MENWNGRYSLQMISQYFKKICNKNICDKKEKLNVLLMLAGGRIRSSE